MCLEVSLQGSTSGSTAYQMTLGKWVIFSKPQFPHKVSERAKWGQSTDSITWHVVKVRSKGNRRSFPSSYRSWNWGLEMLVVLPTLQLVRNRTWIENFDLSVQCSSYLPSTYWFKEILKCTKKKKKKYLDATWYELQVLLGYYNVPKMSLDKVRHGSDAPIFLPHGTSPYALRINFFKKSQKWMNMRWL